MLYTEYFTNYNVKKEEVKPMPTNEKEINNYLFDQLSMLERIERQLKKGGVELAQEEIDIFKSEIKRKLYQKLPLISEE